MLAWLAAKLVSAPIIGGILKPIISGALDAYKAKLDSETSREAIAADLAKRKIDLDQREAEVNAQVLVAEQGNWMTRWVRPMWAAPFVIYTWCVVVFGYCWPIMVVKPLPPQMALLMQVIAGAYFGMRGLQYVARELRK